MLLAAAGICTFAASPRTYRIGVDDAPPLSERQPDGSAGGLAVEIISEAARRRGIALEWVITDRKPDEALLAGEVDLWPVIGETEERKRVLHLTRPWFFNTFALITRKGVNIRTPADVQGRRVSFTGFPLATSVALRYLPGAKLEPQGGRLRVYEAVCEGRADAGFEEASYTSWLMLNRPAACRDVDFSVHLVKDAVANGALASTKEAASVADDLRQEISRLAADGTMAASLERWASFSANETRSVLSMQAAEDHARLLAWTLFFAFAAVCCLGWQIRRAIVAKRRAELANSAKSDFLANMSHEIRTPMNGVLGLLQLVLGDRIDESRRGDLELVRQSAQSLLRVINDILDVSALEAGQLRIERTDFSLRTCLEDLVRFFQPTAKKAGIELSLFCPPELPPYIMGDAARVRQIVMNFIGNALKFTEQGRVKVDVTIQAEDENLIVARIAVHDTGIGIAPEHQKALFRKFSQIDSSSRRKYGGTGLGLSISRQLAQQMGGIVGFRSRPGEGSTFWVELPLGRSSAVSETPAPNARTAENRVVEPAQIRRILVAEDNRVNQHLISRALEKFGYQVEIAATGREAVELWKTGRFDLILMDCQMPEMTGYEASRVIRSRERGKTPVPIVAVTAHAMPDEEARCRQAGMDAYLTKPIDFGQLYAVLDRYAPLSRTDQDPVNCG